MTEDDTSSSSYKPQYIGGERVAVLLPLPLASAYDYRVPEGMILQSGDFVDVPLGPRIARGVVWGAGEGSVAENKLKSVAALLDFPPLPKQSLDFIAWVSRYIMAPPGAVLRMVMSTPEAIDPPKPVIAYTLVPDPPAFRSTTARERVIAVLRDGPPRLLSDLALEAATGSSVIKGLKDAGVVQTLSLGTPPPPAPDPDQEGPILSADQQIAADQLSHSVKDHTFSVHVLDGVPGSGKTEVYFEAIATALRKGKQALVLLPEIALGAQWR